MQIVEQYVSHLVKSVKGKVALTLSSPVALDIVNRVLRSHLEDARNPRGFHHFYLEILGNRQGFLTSNDFFKRFAMPRTGYSLVRNIPRVYREKLETEKHELLRLIDAGHFIELYFEYFAVNGGYAPRNFGSFFTKFVHTFRPKEYCALDNPIRDYFGLANESFFISWIVVSAGYREWAGENQDILERIRKQVREMDMDDTLKVDRLSDLKILDLIFWHIANSDRKDSGKKKRNSE